MNVGESILGRQKRTRLTEAPIEKVGPIVSVFILFHLQGPDIKIVCDFVGLTVLFALRAFEVAIDWMADEQAEFAGRGQFDLEFAVCIRHREVGMVEDADVRLHPRVDIARQNNRPRVRDQRLGELESAARGNQRIERAVHDRLVLHVMGKRRIILDRQRLAGAGRQHMWDETATGLLNRRRQLFGPGKLGMYIGGGKGRSSVSAGRLDPDEYVLEPVAFRVDEEIFFQYPVLVVGAGRAGALGIDRILFFYWAIPDDLPLERDPFSFVGRRRRQPDQRADARP